MLKDLDGHSLSVLHFVPTEVEDVADLDHGRDIVIGQSELVASFVDRPIDVSMLKNHVRESEKGLVLLWNDLA